MMDDLAEDASLSNIVNVSVLSAPSRYSSSYRKMHL